MSKRPAKKSVEVAVGESLVHKTMLATMTSPTYATTLKPATIRRVLNTFGRLACANPAGIPPTWFRPPTAGEKDKYATERSNSTWRARHVAVGLAGEPIRILRRLALLKKKPGVYVVSCPSAKPKAKKPTKPTRRTSR